MRNPAYWMLTLLMCAAGLPASLRAQQQSATSSVSQFSVTQSIGQPSESPSEIPTGTRFLVALQQDMSTKNAKAGERVRAGQPIGIIGADPLDGEGLMHLHFELWFRGAHEAAIDPESLMATWVVAPARVELVAST